MATGPILEFDALLAPIPGDNPAGELRVPHDVEDKVKEYRREDTDADPPKFAAWDQVVRISRSALEDRSKHLRIAAYLTQGLTNTNGFAGLRDGLILLRRLVQECWDRLGPEIEDGDLEPRAGPFEWLDDSMRGSLVPVVIKGIALVRGKDGAYSWQDYRGNPPKVSADDFKAAIMTTPRQTAQDQVEDLEQCRAALTDLAVALGERLGPSLAPGMTNLRKSLEDVEALAKGILNEIPGAAAVDPSTTGEGTASGETTTARSGGAAGAAASREEIYNQLRLLSDRLKNLEPHSPVPYLIGRAVELGSMPYPMLMKTLIRNPDLLADLNREFGIKEETSA